MYIRFSHFPTIRHSFQALRHRHRFHRFPGLRQSWELWQRRVSLFSRTQPIRGTAGRPGVSWGRFKCLEWWHWRSRFSWWLIVLFMVINDKWIFFGKKKPWKNMVYLDWCGCFRSGPWVVQIYPWFTNFLLDCRWSFSQYPMKSPKIWYVTIIKYPWIPHETIIVDG